MRPVLGSEGLVMREMYRWETPVQVTLPIERTAN